MPPILVESNICSIEKILSESHDIVAHRGSKTDEMISFEGDSVSVRLGVEGTDGESLRCEYAFERERGSRFFLNGNVIQRKADQHDIAAFLEKRGSHGNIEDVEFCSDRCKNLSDVHAIYGEDFVPTRGWIGHIEL